MLKQNLWGSHILGVLWRKGVDESEYHHLTGLSSAHFQIPDSRMVTLKGGSEIVPGALNKWRGSDDENQWDAENHYCFRIIRVTVRI
jgi:hypothetical protein